MSSAPVDHPGLRPNFNSFRGYSLYRRTHSDSRLGSTNSSLADSSDRWMTWDGYKKQADFLGIGKDTNE